MSVNLISAPQSIFNPLPPALGGEGRVRGVPAPGPGEAHLTLPAAEATGPRPLPPMGGEGEYVPIKCALRDGQ
jgi:hypothetical protein